MVCVNMINPNNLPHPNFGERDIALQNGQHAIVNGYDPQDVHLLHPNKLCILQI